MSENPRCELCELHLTAGKRAVCLKGQGGDNASLMIYLSAPTIVEDRRGQSFVSDEAELLKWLLKRMSVNSGDVYVDYVLKCYPKPNKNFGKKAFRAEMIEACSTYRVATLQLIRPKVIVAMGATACEAFLGSSKVSEYDGVAWIPNEPFVREVVERVWVTYAPAYALQDAAESVTIYRTLFSAAMEAGLNPQFNPNLPAFDYGT